MDQRGRWVLRCRDLLLQPAYIITERDRATGDVLVQITGSKSVRLAPADVARLRRHLAEADRDAGAAPESA